MTSRSFIKNGQLVVLDSDPGELYQHHSERGMFVVGQHPTNQQEYDEAVKYSRILINSKYLKCTYSNQITTNLQIKLSKVT